MSTAIVRVYHGTTRAWFERALVRGIDAHEVWKGRPHHIGGKPPFAGIYVTPRIKTALTRGPVVITMRVPYGELQPALSGFGGPTVADSWSYPGEPQAMLIRRIEPFEVKLAYVCPDYPWETYAPWDGTS